MKVIHVDDHTLFAEGFSSMLEDLTQFEVVSKTNARDALKYIDEAGEVDLIVADLQLQGMNGFSMIQAIERRGLLVPVVVISATEDLWEIRRVMDAGAQAFIPKTANIKEIVEILDRVMTYGEIYLPPDIEAGLSRLSRLEENKSGDSLKVLMANYGITERQLEVLRLMREGYSNDDIATILYVAKTTVKSHAGSLFKSFQVGGRIKCVREAESLGFFDERDSHH